MRTSKTETLTVRLTADVKATLRQAAKREHRSLANMLEILIRDWWDAREAVPNPVSRSAGHQDSGPASDN